MKILWITNTPLGVLGEKVYGRRSNGLWMSALLDDFVQQQECQLVIATSIPRRETDKAEENGVVFYGIPDQYPLRYNENKSKNIVAWEGMLRQEKPDLIQVWGTEFSHGLCALRLASKMGIPSVIYMQGYLGSIARHYLAGLTHKELRKSITFRDIVKQDSIEQQQKKYALAVNREKEMLQLAGAIICENDWCENSVRAIVPDIIAYRCPLSVNQVFTQKNWSLERVEKHSIICNASGYPLKGLHMMLRAVALLKRDYPDIRLYVPGTPMVADGSLQWLIRKRGYTKYIENLIRELGVEQNIVWLGRLTHEQLAEQYAKAHVFVMSSAIENHSSSLKEAMMVGVPSIAAAVGGVPEYVRHGENGFLYRFEEYEIMAGYVKQIFEDDDLANRLSRQTREDIHGLHAASDIYRRVLSIYEDILKEG